MTEITSSHQYFTLDKQEEQKFILSQNLQALINEKNEAIAGYTRAVLTIPAALVQLKWQNRREIYPFLVKEEVYGAVLEEIMKRYPQLRAQILTAIEENYQQIKAQEAETLMLSRRLAEGNCQTSSVTSLPEPPVASPDK
ncbi:cytoplasmic protein [Cronobacter sakazakii]|nr:cytoplasmic protein [Cronobacter sakazakii]